MALAFINYRRADSAQASRAIHAQLRSRFGPSHVFFDVNAILPGSQWPAKLKTALDTADVLLLVLGPRWLSSANEYGVRRLDEPEDWVRLEIESALKANKPIIPLLVAGLEQLPPAAALPESIAGILNYQWLMLRDERWDRDFAELVEVLESEYGFIDNQLSINLPEPQVDISALSADQLSEQLKALRGWKPVESLNPKHYPKPRQELRRAFNFSKFSDAVDFIQALVPVIEKHQHHPRMENQWRTVTVFLTTWDIGNRISQLDVDLAKEIDQLYASKR